MKIQNFCPLENDDRLKKQYIVNENIPDVFIQQTHILRILQYILQIIKESRQPNGKISENLIRHFEKDIQWEIYTYIYIYEWKGRESKNYTSDTFILQYVCAERVYW